MKYKIFPYIFITAFILLWSTITAITSYNLPLDVLENLSWGQLWQWGYYKHPPLQAWLQELMVMIFGHQDWPAYLLGFASVGLSFYGVYAIAKWFKYPGWLAALLPVGAASIYYYTFRATEFNANVASLPIWVAYIAVFLRACEYKNIPYWLLLGFIAALGMYTKYSFAILLFASLPSILIIKKYRPLLWHYGPYLAVLVMMACLLPHIVWLIRTDFLPLQYIGESVAIKVSILHHIFNPLIFALIQLSVSLSALVIFWFVAQPRFKSQYSASEKLAISMVITPLITMMLIGWLSPAGLRIFWGYTLPITFVFLWAIIFDWQKRERPIIAYIAILILLLPLVTYTAIRLGRPYIKDYGKRIDYDGLTFAQTAKEYWYKNTGQPNLPILLAGDHWAIENISWYSAERPFVVVGGHENLNPWIYNIDLPQKILWVGWGKPTNEAKEFITHVEQVNFGWHNKRYKRKNPYYFAIIDRADIKK
ncbi:MAG: glycosyltransferase family 39 protein [Alphaproteobacteria bacterium]